MRSEAGPVTEISVNKLRIFPYEDSNPGDWVSLLHHGVTFALYVFLLHQYVICMMASYDCNYQNPPLFLYLILIRATPPPPKEKRIMVNNVQICF